VSGGWSKQLAIAGCFAFRPSDCDRATVVERKSRALGAILVRRTHPTGDAEIALGESTHAASSRFLAARARVLWAWRVARN
jgi:hypothetical protein